MTDFYSEDAISSDSDFFVSPEFDDFIQKDSARQARGGKATESYYDPTLDESVYDPSNSTVKKHKKTKVLTDKSRIKNGSGSRSTRDGMYRGHNVPEESPGRKRRKVIVGTVFSLMAIVGVIAVAAILVQSGPQKSKSINRTFTTRKRLTDFVLDGVIGDKLKTHKKLQFRSHEVKSTPAQSHQKTPNRTAQMKFQKELGTVATIENHRSITLRSKKPTDLLTKIYNRLRSSKMTIDSEKLTFPTRPTNTTRKSVLTTSRPLTSAITIRKNNAISLKSTTSEPILTTTTQENVPKSSESTTSEPLSTITTRERVAISAKSTTAEPLATTITTRKIILTTSKATTTRQNVPKSPESTTSEPIITTSTKENLPTSSKSTTSESLSRTTIQEIRSAASKSTTLEAKSPTTTASSEKSKSSPSPSPKSLTEVKILQPKAYNMDMDDLQRMQRSNTAHNLTTDKSSTLGTNSKKDGKAITKCVTKMVQPPCTCPTPPKAAQRIQRATETIKKKKGLSLAFILDETMSMNSTLTALQNAIVDILSKSMKYRVFSDFIIQPFKDTLTPLVKTRSISKMKKVFDKLFAVGGGNCPEHSISAIYRAAFAANPGSYFFVFTDASAADDDLLEETLKIIKKKNISVLFFLDVDQCLCMHVCDLIKTKVVRDYKPYKRIADVNNGKLVYIRAMKDNVQELMRYLTAAMKLGVNEFSKVPDDVQKMQSKSKAIENCKCNPPRKERYCS